MDHLHCIDAQIVITHIYFLKLRNASLEVSAEKLRAGKLRAGKLRDAEVEGCGR